jgi:hypothetical protein
MTEAPYDDINTAPDIVELTTLDEFERWRRAPHGCIVIKDSTSGTPIAHHRDCFFVDSASFNEKVVAHGGANGRYWWAKNSRIAEAELRARRHPGDSLAK